MLGLNDRHIAKRQMPDTGSLWQKKAGHSKGDGNYVLQRKPDYIIMNGAAGGADHNEPVFASDIELDRLEEFKRCYKSEQVTVDRFSAPLSKSLKTEDWKTSGTFNFKFYRRVCPK
jgi:hypothetical protein